MLSIKQCNHNEYLLMVPIEWEEREIKNYLADTYGVYRQRVQVNHIVYEFEKKKQKLVRVKVIGGIEMGVE